jgi:ADP-ribose pyrophosphatase YjhB (NUDIX family)
MTAPAIRAKAVCVCRRGDQALLVAAFDPTKRETFYGPPGGGVEFGERAAEAVRREMREELAVEVGDLTLLGVLENIFTYDGRPGHEVVFVFDARLVDGTLYEREEIAGVESNAEPFVARWVPLAHFASGGPPLYPEGLLALLQKRSHRGGAVECGI